MIGVGGVGPTLTGVLERLAGLEDEYVAVEAQLADPDVLADHEPPPHGVEAATRS